jgi:hypothetical protein
MWTPHAACAWTVVTAELCREHADGQSDARKKEGMRVKRFEAEER